MEGTSTLADQTEGINPNSSSYTSLALPTKISLLCVFLFLTLILKKKNNKGDEKMNGEKKGINLLDGHLEDIKFPSLSPRSTPALLPLCGPGGLMDACLDALQIATLEPERKKVSKEKKITKSRSTVASLVPWSGDLNWAMKGTSVFDTGEEEYSVLANRGNLFGDHFSQLWFFQYGLRYIPAVTDQNVYRTVVIEELPMEITLSQILPYIKGEVYSARLTNTITITGYNTALIVFVAQDDALEFLRLYSKQGSKKSKYQGESGKKPPKEDPNLKLLPVGKVIQVKTPTYPIPSDIDRLVVECGHTRCLALSRDYEQAPLNTEEVRRALHPAPNTKARVHQFPHLIECIEAGERPGEVCVKFLSIRAASNGFKFLKGHSDFWMCRFRFLAQDGDASSPASLYPPPTKPTPSTVNRGAASSSSSGIAQPESLPLLADPHCRPSIGNW